MAMTTRCPQCGTVFKVVADQLRVRNGLVRCGVCAAVFDGYACLATGAAPPPPRRMPPAVFRNRADMLRAVPPPQPEPDEPEPGEPGFSGEHDFPAYGPGLSGTVPELPVEPVFAEIAPENYRPWYGADDAPQADAERDPSRPAVFGEARPRPLRAPDAGPGAATSAGEPLLPIGDIRRRLWAGLVVLAAVALVLQVALVYRTPLASAAPVLRPVLDALCAPFGCKAGYVRRLERISIMSSSLQPVQGAAADSDPMRLTLRVVLRNRYDRPQPWPALIVDLTDLSDTVVVRKALPPESYLPPALAAGPFGPGQEVGLNIPLEVAGVRVNGYQLDKYFP